MELLTGEVTRLLIDLRSGRDEARPQLLVLLYDELRRIARNHLRRERPGHTLQPTALVNEAYIRLVEQEQQNWENRSHFFGICAQVMRQILVDHARKRLADKRGGRGRALTFDESGMPGTQRPENLVALDEALSRLAAFDLRQSQVVELRFFGGWKEDEIGHMLGTSVRTIKRDWNFARAWLYNELTK